MSLLSLLLLPGGDRAKKRQPQDIAQARERECRDGQRVIESHFSGVQMRTRASCSGWYDWGLHAVSLVISAPLRAMEIKKNQIWYRQEKTHATHT